MLLHLGVSQNAAGLKTRHVFVQVPWNIRYGLICTAKNDNGICFSGQLLRLSTTSTNLLITL